MDLGFLRRAERKFLSRAPARLDYPLLVAMLRAQRTGGSSTHWAPAARARIDDPVVEIVLAGALWREAVSCQRGSFNPRRTAQGGVN